MREQYGLRGYHYPGAQYLDIFQIILQLYVHQGESGVNCQKLYPEYDAGQCASGFLPENLDES